MEPPEAFSHCYARTLRIENEDSGSCSGFILRYEEQDWLVTARHVVTDVIVPGNGKPIEFRDRPFSVFDKKGAKHSGSGLEKLHPHPRIIPAPAQPHLPRQRLRPQGRHPASGIAILDPTLSGLAAEAFTADHVRVIPTLLSKTGYSGPRPIPGHGPRRYRFHVPALDCPVPTAIASMRHLITAASSHVIASGVLAGNFER